MKRLSRHIFPLLLSVILLLSAGTTVLATGEGNMEGGGGSMGSGTATDVWHNLDGVRVTVVTEDGGIVSTPFDLSNANVANNVLNFGKVCKLQYSSGSSLSPNGSYSYSKPGTALPRIISGRNRASMDAIKRYFCSEYAAQLVADKTGIPKPLLRRLLLTFLAGGGCFLIGLVFFLREGDMPFFTLSILLFLFSCGKGILFFLQVKKKAYTVLEGICTDVRMNLLGGTQYICLSDAEGDEHCLMIGKDHKIRTGLSYRFYFRDSDGISPGRNPLLKKALLTDNLLGVEETAAGPSTPG